MPFKQFPPLFLAERKGKLYFCLMKKYTRTITLLFVVIIALPFACKKGEQTDVQESVAITGESDIDNISLKITKTPDNADLYALRAEMYYDKNSFDQAIQDMTTALSIDSTNINFHHLLSDIYLDYFRSNLALKTMERAVILEPENIESLLKLSEIQLFLKQNVASMQTIDKVLKIDPQNALAYFFMGMNFEEMGDINRAINSFQESSEIDPEMLDTWIKLGQLHATANTSLAEDFFNNAIELDSSSTVALSAKAEYLWHQDKPKEALELYKTAIRKDPMSETSYYNAGLVLMELDSVEQAYEHFNMAIENSPLYVGAYFYRGYAAELMGKKEQAKKDYEHALRLAPEYTDALDGLDRVR